MENLAVITLPTKVEKSKEQKTEDAKNLFETYLKENNELFRIDKVRDANVELYSLQRGNLRCSLNLGRLISEGLQNFDSDENKQLRKSARLNITTEHFIKTAYGFNKQWAYKLVKAHKLPEDIKEAYLKTGNLESEVSIAGLLKFADPTKKDAPNEDENTGAITEPNESAPVNEEQTAPTEVETVEKFGGIELHLNKATKEDITAAIAYLTAKLA